MLESNPRSTARLLGRPIHPMLVPVPVTCFVGTFFTDLAYAKTANMQWANFSAWLLTIGLLFAILAAIAGLIDFFAERRIRALPSAWIHALGNALAIIISIFNWLIHSRDAYTSVVPTGLILSGIVLLILLVTAWNGWTMVYRHGVAVRPEDRP